MTDHLIGVSQKIPDLLTKVILLSERWKQQLCQVFNLGLLWDLVQVTPFGACGF